MRAVTFITGPFVCLVVATACGGGDDNNADDSTGKNDAGGDAGSVVQDASPADATSLDGGDASLPQPTTATVTVVQDTAAGPVPISGAKVLFYSQDGSPLSVMTTGADGKVTATVLSGQSVTTSSVLSAAFQTHTLTTFIGIEPGDNLVAHAPIDRNNSSSIRFNPPVTSYPGAADYLFADGCYVSDDPNFFFADNSCIKNGKLDAIVFAVDAHGSILAYAQKTGIPYTPGMTLPDLGAWSAAINKPLTFTGALPALPPGSSKPSFDLHLLVHDQEYATMSLPTGVDGGGIGANVGLPMGSFLTDAVVHVELGPAVPENNANSAIEGYRRDVFGPLAMDLSGLGPIVHAPAFLADDAGHAAVEFAEEASILGFDGMTTLINWSGGNWTVISKATTAMAFPPLTIDLTPTFPQSTDLQTINVERGYGSYNAYRNKTLVLPSMIISTQTAPAQPG